MPPKGFTLTRDEAAERLNISIRTLDRTIRRGLLSVKRTHRNVWISDRSLESYLKNLENPLPEPKDNPAPPVETTTVEVSESDPSENLPESAPISHTRSRTRSQRTYDFTPHEHDYDTDMTAGNIFKTLYEQVKEKYDEQAKRLEAAHYRVGQLEAQIKTMIPELEYKKQQKQFLLMDQKYKENITAAKSMIAGSRKETENERWNKNVILALVYGLLALQPVFWVLTQAS